MLASELIKLSRTRASDSVYEALRDNILSGKIASGERLNVNLLAAALDVSITPVKEAINRLATEGLIVINPRSGTYVAELSAEQIAETFEIRTALECLAIEKAMARMTETDRQQIRQLVEEMEQPTTSERARVLHESKNVEFHQLLIELSGNKKLAEIYHSLNTHLSIARIHRSKDGWESRLADDKQEHREILNAIEAGKTAQAVRAVRRHIERAAADLIKDLKTNDAVK